MGGSSSTCCAESLNPIGIPPVAARTSSAKSLNWSSCSQSGLVEAFRALYPDEMTFEGNRAIVFGADEPVPEAALRHCIALALTHHRRKRRRRAP